MDMFLSPDLPKETQERISPASSHRWTTMHCVSMHFAIQFNSDFYSINRQCLDYLAKEFCRTMSNGASYRCNCGKK